MTVVRLLLVLLGLGLVVQIVFAAGSANFLDSFGAVAADPWGLVSLVDLYLGFAVAAVLVAVIEPDARVKWPLIVALFFLGNPLLAFWAAWRLPMIVAMASRR